ncbi:multiubiquitin domain-containing protein [Methylotenera sp.]|uniref:multiubiquitin domain-containing protein n=1 Tax=Methylotenera sp. TaxID=2051956 RepID=UPI002722DDE5|nr:multiubiquitin domain-containing protein [Methylotenera sp.]MDO9204054.1 multiubiquitin domain-containing protein [Methylotenera sp.]
MTISTDHEVKIEVNDVQHTVPKGKLSFDDLVKLAFGEDANPADGYRISFDRGHGNASGKLKLGASIEVVEDMDFTVTGTGQS